ncbi:FAD:protein FMN transferase [Cohnella endophytica]|nr:FAD:protein FMN transferase [Cohnella endophytica]
MEQDHFRAMNTEIDVALMEGRPEDEVQSLHEIRNWFVFVEGRFSRFLPESELSRLNASRGFPVRVSSVMLEVLSHAVEYKRLTKGIYEPCILRALEYAGYDRSFETIENYGGFGLPQSAMLEAPSYRSLERSWTTYPIFNLARLSRGTSLDLGGLVKGWSVDRIVSWLMVGGIEAGQVNAGGDLKVWGWGQNDRPAWEVDIPAPWTSRGQKKPDILATAQLKQGAAATSGTTKRRWKTPSGVMHHLIDPRTGFPADSDVMQCTVLGASVADAEIVAKTICILGSKEGEAWAKEAFPGYDALLVTADKSVRFVHGKGSNVCWKEAR